MLPIFPKAKEAMNKVRNEEMFAALWGVCPILKEIRVRAQTEGNRASYQREDGKIIEMNYNHRSADKSWKLQDAQGFSPEDFIQAASDLGQALGNKILADLFKSVSDAADEVGNVVKIIPNTLTFENYLEMAAKMYTEFDEFGLPRPKTIVLPPNMLQQFQTDIRKWAADPAKLAAIEKVMENHRKIFNENEASRRMVD
jgi:hypothetical protein